MVTPTQGDNWPALHFFSAKGSSGFACLVLVDFWFGLVLFRLFFIVVVILLCFVFALARQENLKRERKGNILEGAEHNRGQKSGRRARPVLVDLRGVDGGDG